MAKDKIRAKHSKPGRPTKRAQVSLKAINSVLKEYEKEIEKVSIDVYRHIVVFGSADNAVIEHYMKLHGIIKK